MSWWEYFKEALKGLAGHKVRAFLSALGILFGVGSVVAVVSVSAGAREQIITQLRAMGASNVMVRSLRGSGDLEAWKRARARTGGGLTVREADYFASGCDLLHSYCPLMKLKVRARYGDRIVGGEVVAVRPDFLKTSGFRLSSGRFLAPLDERLARRVCVLEEQVARLVFGAGGALGRRVWIDAEPYEVVGVLESKQVSERKYEVTDVAALNRRIYVPLKTGLARITRDRLSGEIDEVIFRAASGVSPRRLARSVSRFYEAAHGTRGLKPEERDYEVTVTLDLVKQVQETQRVFSIVLGAGAGISLLVGGIGIMNIMLANIQERRREVGIRRAMGATKGDILWQFLMEALCVCLGGGLLGLALGCALSAAINYWAEWVTDISAWGLVLSLGVAVLDGVAFGTYPAWKAARLDPIEALQYE
jgi:putative ABC transport system permease protein